MADVMQVIVRTGAMGVFAPVNFYQQMRSPVLRKISHWKSRKVQIGHFFVRGGIQPKMESTLFVPSKLTFSEYLRCLNFLLWILWPAITKQVEESDLFWDTAPTSSAKFKHLKFSENVNFEGTNSFDSILVEFTIFCPQLNQIKQL